MVKLHHPSQPQPIVGKALRRLRTPPSPKHHCIICHAELRGDHAADLVCDCHPRDGYEPRHDPALDEHVLVLLWRAKGATLNVCRALGAFPSKSNHDAVEDAVARLNRGGFVRIVGVPGHGFRMAVAGRRQKR